MPKYICVTCGTQYSELTAPPEGCVICEDDRQYVNPQGQQWTTLEAEQGKHTTSLSEIAPGITTIATEPKLGIGERAYLLQTPHGNVIWDLVAYFDQATVEEIKARGEVRAIAISHPHFFTTMADWSAALGGAPIYLHADHRPWVVRPDESVRYWDGETQELLPGMTLIRCGGHFPGSSALHWAAAHDGAGALFTGDTIKVVADTRWATFMYSYPNTIPLDERTVRHIAESVATREFAHLYDGWTAIAGDAHAAVQRSAARYIAHLRGESESESESKG